ncbi:hypothetical protein QQZ08_004432 [Neonectria magnoliae]|uniref:Apple domain-containing protein n=1 Tax=Neonectria magnoliae TaxID=2732573 RepID=A0ABR1I6C4_9HYPO
MRSAAALVALAFGASFDVVAAGLCKPSDTLTASISVRDATETGTGTTAPEASTTQAPVAVTNAIANGNFAGYDPNSPGGIYGFEVENDARLIQGHGYQDDGSTENNCVGMSARAAKKRDVGEFAAIEQQLENMDTTSLYTVRFWYYILQNDITDTCKFDVYYGDDLFASSPYFPLAQPTDPYRGWDTLIEQAAVKTSSGLLRFELNCVNDGYAQIWVDQVFVSNQVSPDNMDNISVIYTWDYSATSTAQQSTTSTADASTMATEVTTTSAAPTTTTSSTTAAQSTTSTTTPSAATPTGNKFCVTLSTGDAGRGCGLKPYNPSSGYKTISNSRMTRDQCGAVCLADSRCQQFQWSAYSSSYACLNTCILIETNLPSTGANNGIAYYAYDRSCIKRTDCTMQPAGSVCVNGLGDTPASDCRKQVFGTAKSCGAAFLVTNVGAVCDSSKECRDVCAKNPGCKSFSINFAGGCSLYSGTISEIVQEGGGGQMFTDMSCSDCGSADMGYFNYITQASVGDTVPTHQCSADSSSSTAITTRSATTSRTSSASIDTTTQPGSTTSPSTTISSPSTTVNNCPAGINSPGACFGATPTAAGSTCEKKGSVQLVDAWSVSSDVWRQNRAEDCALYCKLDSQCKSYGFDRQGGMTPCRFSPESLTNSGFVQDSTASVTWSDLGCVTCILCGGAASPTTMLSTTVSTTSSVPTATSTCALTNGQGCTMKALVEAQYTCNRAGSPMEEAWGYNMQDYPFQGSPEQCAAICAQQRNCKASAYDSSRTSYQCSFIGNSLQAAGFSASGGSIRWSDQACWDCPTCSAAASIITTAAASSTASAFTTFETSTRTATTSDGEGESTTSEEMTSTASDEALPTTTEESTSTVDESSTENQTTTSTAPESTTDLSDITSIPEQASATATSTTSTTSAAPTPAWCVATASLSDDVTCGLPGAAGNQAQSNALSGYVIKPVANLNACAQNCLDRFGCLGFQYTTDSKVCYLYRVGTSGLGLTYSPTSRARFYDRDCYRCS